MKIQRLPFILSLCITLIASIATTIVIGGVCRGVQTIESPQAAPLSTPIPRTKEIKKTVQIISGEASYYSEAGCLGCHPDLIMKNGERLSDEAVTIAVRPSDYQKNAIVTVVNLSNGNSVKARITDTGGFGKYGRVADLSLATKNAIGCSDLCNVGLIK